ncbi:MAG: GyrI-like domain-containing protein [Flavobacteriales bacterium]|nr:GyrI-like domain-containing protein [Flavobacteriales bacterium]
MYSLAAMKIDYKKEYKELYKISQGKFAIIDVPEFNYLMIDGEGSKETDKFHCCVDALIKLSESIKFMVKKGELGIDYPVMPLEALWWPNEKGQFDPLSKNGSKWRLMIMQPHIVTEEMVNQGFKQTKAKCKLSEIGEIRFDSFKERHCAHTIHLGPFEEAQGTLDNLNAFIEDEGFMSTGVYHEIYLSDNRKVLPEKRRTLIRQPIS